MYTIRASYHQNLTRRIYLILLANYPAISPHQHLSKMARHSPGSTKLPCPSIWLESAATLSGTLENSAFLADNPAIINIWVKYLQSSNLNLVSTLNANPVLRPKKGVNWNIFARIKNHLASLKQNYTYISSLKLIKKWEKTF